MSELIIVLIGLGAALIGYLVGRHWQTLKVRRRNWKARQFWQPVVDGEFQMVISRFSVQGFREDTGLVGGGDAIASRLLREQFDDIGLSRPETVYVDESDLDRNKNLIVLGGPLENRVADEALKRMQPGLRVTDPGPGRPNQVDDLRARPPDGDAKGRTTPYVAEPGVTDYGVIIRARSPFHADRALVVISGAYGYGTWAGVQLSQTKDFLRRCAELDASTLPPLRALALAWSRRPRLGIRRSAVSQWAQIECLYRVDVLDRRPQTSQIVVFRRIVDSERGLMTPSRPEREIMRNELRVATAADPESQAVEPLA